MEYSYAAMLSNGDVIDTPRDSDGRKDLTVRFQASYLLGGKARTAKTSAHSCGGRMGRDCLAGTFRDGARRCGAQISARQLRASAEYLHADGNGYRRPVTTLRGQPFAAGVNEKPVAGMSRGLALLAAMGGGSAL